MKREKDRLILALEKFYREMIDNNGKVSDLFMLRLSQESKICKDVLKVWINKINQTLIGVQIREDWNLREIIRETVNPDEVERERYEMAVRDLHPEITIFELERIASKFNLNAERRKMLRYRAEEMKREEVIKKTSASRLESAKRELKRIFLSNPQELDKPTLKKIAKKHDMDFVDLSSYYRRKKSEWIEIRESCSTIEDLPS